MPEPFADIFPENSLDIVRYIPVKERDAIDDADFAGPNRTFPCDTQEHLDSCAKLLGHADDPDAVKAKAKKIAKRKGLTLPKSWQEDNPSMDKASAADILRTMPSEVQLFAPIIRVDKEKREVVVRATSETKDSYNTRFRYDASKEAFGKWRGNIREMHQNIAVGRALKWEGNDESKAIDVTLRVSRGAEDTWQKVLDGTLMGASVGARNGVWETETVDGEDIPVLTRYDLVEVSLVDNPSNPDCNISIIRADGVATEVLQETAELEEIERADSPEEPVAEETASEQPEETRAGQRISHATSDDLHLLRNSAMLQAQKAMLLCDCEECHSGVLNLDPDMDGDIDILPSMDTDNDGGAGGDGSGDGGPGAPLNYAAVADIVRRASEEYTTNTTNQLKALISRFSSIAANLSQIDTHETPETTRRLEAVETKIDAELAKVHSALAEVKSLAVAIANQPQSGGPVVNSALLRNQPAQGTNTLEYEQLAIERLSRAGVLNKDQQINAALYLQRQVNGR